LAGKKQLVKTQPESKTDTAYRLLEEKIVTMELAPGVLLSESELALELGLGRTPVREALQRLASEYLVEIMPRRGVRVTDIEIKKQLRLLEVRRLLEQLNAGMAARRADLGMKTRFSEIAESMVEAAAGADYLSFLHLDSEFNELMIKAADNEFSASMLRKLHGLSRRFWHNYYRHEDDLPLVADIHAAIARAISSGDEDAAAAASMAHMDYIHSFTRAALEK
jgi:DNA-binding GntR family transcriptional regulator